LTVTSEEGFLEKKVKEIDEFFEAILKMLNCGSGGVLKCSKDISFLKTGSLGLSCGWQEDTDWHAFYKTECWRRLIQCSTQHQHSGQLAVVAGAPWEFRRGWAGPGGLHGDVYLDLTSLGSSILRIIERKILHNREDQVEGKILPGVEGSVDVGLTARLGCEYILAVRIKGFFSSGLVAEGEITLNREACGLAPR